MDQRTFSAMVLSMAVLLSWQAYRKSMMTPEQLAELNGTSIEAPVEAPGETVQAPPVEVEPKAPVKPFVAPDQAKIPVKDIELSACSAVGQWTTDGGSLRSIVLPDYEAPTDVMPLYSYILAGLPDGISGWSPYGGELGELTVATDKAEVLSMGSGALASVSPRTVVLEESPGKLVLSGTTADGIEVRRTVTARDTEDGCAFDVELAWTNNSGADYSGKLWVGMHDEFSGDGGYYTNVPAPYAMYDGDVEWFAETSELDDEVEAQREGEVSWIGLSDRYFGVWLVPETETGEVYLSRRTQDETIIDGVSLVVATTLAAGESHVQKGQMYIGPRDYDLMERIDEDLAYLVKWEYGWFALFCFPLLWLLKFFFSVTGNWGLAIIALTVAMKSLFYPLTQKAFESGEAMKALQPQLAEAREKYKDEPEELNRRTIELFRENGVNPVGGCLPMLVQMPVWFALYRVLLSSVDLYHTDFLYMADLSVTDPYLVLPTIVVIAMLIQQQLTPTAPNMDPQQARMLKMMPLLFGFFFFTFPSGLVLYIFVNMLLTIAQQWLIRRQFQLPSEKTDAPAAAAT